MIQITPQMRILVALEPVDFRKGIDGLMGIYRCAMGLDPFSGYVLKPFFCRFKLLYLFKKNAPSINIATLIIIKPAPLVGHLPFRYEIANSYTLYMK